MRSLPDPKFFLSLKWKALLLSSLVLIVVTGSIVTLNYIELREQFEQHRVESKNQDFRQIQGLLKQSSEQLQQWGTIIASMLSNIQVYADSDGKQMIAAFEHLAAILELDLGMESIMLISSGGHFLARHGLEPGSELRISLTQVSQQVMITESPTALLDCSESCLQYAIVPILGTNGITLVLGLSLADIVLNFQQISGTDLGLLVGQAEIGSAANGHNERWLPQWGVKIAALSNFETNLEVLHIAASQIKLFDNILQSTHINIRGHEYELWRFPLTSFRQRGQEYLVMITDISAAMANIRTTFQNNILLGIFGLVLSEILLLAILWAPMSRLRSATTNLPWLAEGAFSRIREAITLRKGIQFFRDEVSVLNDTAVALSFQLEALNNEIAERTQDLAERMTETTQQRDFVNHILETAQAIILTQDRKNRILRINPYGLKITGYDLIEVERQPFVTLLGNTNNIGYIQRQLIELVSGVREHIEIECDLSCKNNEIINVIWYHSRLKINLENEPIILSIGIDITARKNAELRLAWLADHDPLTNLYNRRRFEQELKKAIAVAKRYQYSGALLFLDVDQFKYINDISGHREGDRLLQKIGSLLPTILRETDVIGRLGGDEFAIILARATAEEAIQTTKKVVACINGIQFLLEDQLHKLSASIGVALFPEHGADIEELLAQADLAMYRVKDSGRGGWYLLSSDDQSQRVMREQVFWKQRVEHALSNDRFLLYAQPILSIRDHTITHYEMLLRMQGDDGSIILPGQFIEIAERSGLIHAIDRMVISKAIQYQSFAEERGLQAAFAVNLSARAFNNPELLNHLKQLLWKTGLNPRRLIFEMTETVAVTDLVAARRFMEDINDIGCRFALDDFGTGFSSFHYLKELPFEFIKIDGSFVRKLQSRTDDQVLVKAMAEIAHTFGKKTIAEYVEDQETLLLLSQYKIDYAQGYYIGKPAPLSNMLEKIS